jgi:TRAP-type C4-dicarboxylate transport system substrate-binding protein
LALLLTSPALGRVIKLGTVAPEGSPWHDAIFFSLLKSLGFRPISLAVNDLMPSLQTGLVEAFAAPPTAALSFQWFGLAPHMSAMRWQALPSVTVISLQTWNVIPEGLRPECESIARRTGRQMEVEARRLQPEAVKAMQQHGLVVHPVPPEAEEAFRRLVRQKAVPALVGRRISCEIYATVQAELEAHRASSPEIVAVSRTAQ